MNNKMLLVAVVGISIIGVVLGLVINARNNSFSLDGSSSNDQRSIDAQQAVSSPTTVPSPTLPIVSKVVKSVDDTTIVITGTTGDLKIPKNSPILKFFKRVNGTLIDATVADVKVGQNVTYKLVERGKEVDFIIEQ